MNKHPVTASTSVVWACAVYLTIAPLYYATEQSDSQIEGWLSQHTSIVKNPEFQQAFAAIKATASKCDKTELIEMYGSGYNYANACTGIELAVGILYYTFVSNANKGDKRYY